MSTDDIIYYLKWENWLLEKRVDFLQKHCTKLQKDVAASDRYAASLTNKIDEAEESVRRYDGCYGVDD